MATHRCALCYPDPVSFPLGRESVWVSRFPNKSATTLDAVEMSLPELRTLVLETSAGDKTQLPLLKLARFGNRRSDRNSLRHNANVDAISGIELDYDAKAVPLEEAAAVLRQSKLTALVYTSPSHAASNPKWRLILPTSADRPPAERARLVARVNGLFAGIMAPESFTLSQAYYFGRVGANPDQRPVTISGTFIDLRNDLDAGAIGKEGRTFDDAPHQSSDEAEAPDELIAAALKAIPNDDVDWESWNLVGMATWRASGGSAGAFAAFDAWSEKCGKYNARNTAEKWSHYFASPPTSIGFGTLAHFARKADPCWRDAHDAEILARMDAAGRDEAVHAAILAEMEDDEPPKATPSADETKPSADKPTNETKPSADGKPTDDAKPKDSTGNQSKADYTNFFRDRFSRGGGGDGSEYDYGEKKATLVRASDVVPRAKNWLWPGHLLRGGLELLTGLPGLGKSQVQCSLVACVSAGLKWPDGAPAIAPMNTIMVTAEDALDQEVVPRLMAAGANLERVHILKSIKADNKRRQFMLAEDLDELQRAIQWIGNVGIITIDPITAYMGGKMDSHKSTEVRSQLGPLKDFAEQSDIAVSAITHPAKNAGHKAIDHFIGSQAFIAAARIGHAVFEEIGEEERPTGRILFTNPKNNPSPKKPTLAYRIAEIVIGQDPNGGNITSPHVVWDESPVDISADAAIAASGQKGTRDEAQEARTFLKSILAAGPRPQEEIVEEGSQLGFTERQLKFAKRKLGVTSFKEHGVAHGAWYWQLPEVVL